MNKRKKARGSQGQTDSGNGKTCLASRDGNRKDLNDSDSDYILMVLLRLIEIKEVPN